MRKNYFFYVLSCFFTILAVTFTACSKDDDGGDSPEYVDLVLDKNSTTIYTGKQTFVSVVSGNKGYTVSSSAPSVATATVDGDVITIIGVADGSAEITVSDKGNKTSKIVVTVSGNVPKASDLGFGYYGSPNQEASRIWVPIVREYSKRYDFTNFERFTMEALVKINFTDIPWGNGNGQNWLNVIMGEEGRLLLRVNRYQESDGSYSTKLNVSTAFGADLNSRVIESNKWYHVAVTFKRLEANKAEIKLIINGVEHEVNSNINADKIDLTTLNGLTKWVDDNDHSLGYDQNYEFFIGSFWNERWLNGCISEVRLWSEVRTPEELKANMFNIDTKNPSASDGLVAYWKFSGNEPLKDISGNGFDAVLINDVAIANSNVEVDLTHFDE